MKRRTPWLALLLFLYLAPLKALPAPSTGVCLRVQIAPLFAGKPLHYNAVGLQTRAGNTLSVSRLTYLLSDLSLIRADGSQVRLANSYGCIDAAEARNAFTLSGVPKGIYAGLRFHIGLLPKVNHSDPASYSVGHPLHPLTGHLHWNWQGGYVFFALEGRYLQPDRRSGGYVYHLATDANLMTVSLRHPLHIATDSAVNLNFDLDKVFDGLYPIRIRPENGGDSTHSARGDRLATQLTRNIERAFRLRSLEPIPADRNAIAPPAMVGRPPHTTAYTLPTPPYFPQPYLPADNPLTVEGVALGRKLFFEKRLSGNNSQSCASCHRPEAAYSDAGRVVSVGIDGTPGERRALPLFNLAWSRTYTWDGARSRLRDQALAPIENTREMHQSLAQAVGKLKEDAEYPALFLRAFGSPGIDSNRIGLAIEQYLLTLISADSKFDRALRGEAEFTDEEKQGLLLFLTEYDPARGKFGADCFHCHGGNLFTEYQFKNNGLDSEFRDEGRYRITHREEDRGKFKTPSLRNVEITGPYMHDGRFATLEEVIEHYNSGIHYSDTLDPNIAKHPADGLHLSAADKKALVAFLKTLTDAKYRSTPP